MDKYSQYHYFDEPVPYKSLLIYPIRMKEYLRFAYYADILLLDKNSIPDPKIISMSYLEYLFYENKNDDSIGMRLYALLYTVLKKDLEEKNAIVFSLDKLKPVFIIDNKLFNGQDFDEIRKIIIEQNNLTPPDETIQKELRDKLDEDEGHKRRMSGNKPSSLEDQMIGVCVATGIPLETVYNMTIRKFIKTIERVDRLLHYKIYASASLSGMVEFKDKSVLRHWLSNFEKDKFGGMLVDYGSVKDKINNNPNSPKK